MKEKKEKIKVKKEKGWALWKTIAIVFSSVVAVAGATVLGVYATGGFDKGKTPAADISFSRDENLYNSENLQYEVTKNFTLTLSTTTLQPAETDITLSFPGLYDHSAQYITDGVITVPEIVQIGVPFEVKVNTYEIAPNVHWNIGGISNLIANLRNSDNQVLSDRIQIAVDVPVYSTETVLCDMNGNELGDRVVKDSDFVAKTKFFPEASEFLYSDNQNNNISDKRKKQSFFELRSENVDFVFSENPYFHANQTSSSNLITGYTFAYADSQIETIKTLSQNNEGEQLYNTIRSYLINNESLSKKSEKIFDIAAASVGEFRIDTSSISTITSGKPFILSVNRTSHSNEFLGATVKSGGANPQNLDFMLSNIGLRFVKGGIEANNDFTFEEGQRIISVDGKNYIMPKAGATYHDNYWKFITDAKGTYNMEVVLLEEDPDEEGKFNLFASSGNPVIYNINLNIKENLAQSLAWSEEARDVLISLSMNGSTPIPQAFSLANFTNNVDNVKFFAYFDKVTSVSQIPSFIQGLELDHAGNYILGNGPTEHVQYFLVPISAKSFIAAGEGSFQIFAATLKQGLDGLLTDSQGRYILSSSLTSPINVNIVKSLHSASIGAGLVSVDGVETGEVTIDEGSQQEIKISFDVAEDSRELVLDAIKKGDISIGTINLFTKNNFSDENVITSRFNLKLEFNGESLVLTLKANANQMLDDDLTITGAVIKDKKSGQIWEIDLEGVVAKIYTPKVENTELNTNWPNGTVTVVQTLTNEKGDTQIYYGDFSDLTLKDFNDQLSQAFTLTDQHGKQNTLKNWSFKSNSAGVIIDEDNHISFVSKNPDATISLVYGNETLATFNLSITAQGIVSYKKSTSNSINDGGMSNAILNETDTIDVSKYGSTNTMTLQNLAKLYLDEAGEDEFTAYDFKFDQDYIKNLSDTDLIALYGKGGMFTLYDKDETVIDITENESATEIRAKLIGSVLGKIAINYNFAKGHKVELRMKGTNSEVNIKLNLNIYSNFNESSISILEKDAKTEIDLAQFEFSLKVGETLKLSDKLTGTYSVVMDGDVYKVVQGEKDNAIASIKNKKLVFEDFWDDDIQTYKVLFSLESDNPFAKSEEISFKINRNVKITGGKFQLNSLNSTSIDTVINVERKSAAEEIKDITFKFIDGSDFKCGGTDGKQIVVNRAPSFDYNEKSKTYQVEVYVKGILVKTVDVTCEFGFGYDALAAQLKHGDSTSATTISYDGVEYILLPYGDENAWSWTIDTTQEATFGEGAEKVTIGKVEVFRRDINHENDKYKNDTNVYSVSGSSKLSITPQKNAITSAMFGLGNENSYMIFHVLNGNSITARIVVPLIVSHVNRSGDDNFVKYSNQTSGKLDIALASPEELIEKGIFEEVYAGEQYTIASAAGENEADFGFLFDGNYKNITREISVAYSSLDGLVKGIDAGTGKISFNHLSDSVDTDVFVVIKMTTRYSGGGIDFFYAIKLLADVEVVGPVYAYDGNAEYVNVDESGNLDIDMDEKYAEDTLHAGETRFAVKSKITKINLNVSYSYAIESITVDAETYYTEEAWSAFGHFEISNDNHLLIRNFQTDKEVKILISRSYDGGLASDDLSVVGGTRYYTFILNDETVYTLSVDSSTPGLNIDENGNMTWEVSANAGRFDYNSDNDDNSFIAIENKHLSNVTEGQYFLSKENTSFYRWNANARIEFVNESGTGIGEYLETDFLAKVEDGQTLYEVKDGKYLKVEDGQTSISNYSSEDNQYIFDANTAVYNKTEGGYQIAHNVKLKDAYTHVQQISFTLQLMRQTGGEGSSTGSADNSNLDVRGLGDANKMFKYNSNTKSFIMYLPSHLSQDQHLTCILFTKNGFKAGQLDVTLKASAVVTLKDNLEVTAGSVNIILTQYIDSVTENETSEDSYSITDVVLEEGQAEIDPESKKVSFHSSLKDRKVVFSVTLNYGKDKDVVFKLPLTVKADITYSAPEPIKVTAGEECTITLKDLGITGGAGKLSFTYNSLNPGVIPNAVSAETTEQTGNLAFSFTANDVSNNGTEVELQVTATVNDSNEEFEIRLFVKVECRGSVSVSYPNPNDSTFEAEYIDTNTTFSSLANFFNKPAVFSEGNRVVLTDKLANTSGSENANATFAENETALVKVKLENATLKYGVTAGSENTTGTVVTDGSIIPNGAENLYFSKSSNVAEGTVTFTITYHGFTQNYIVKIVDNTLALDIKGENTTLSGSTVLEDFYVESLDNNDLKIFSDGRLISYKVASNASTGKYILKFKDDNDNYNNHNIEIKLGDRGNTFLLDGHKNLGAYVGAYREDSDTDLSDELFEIKPTTKSRINLSYNGEEVSYSKFSGLLTVGEGEEKKAISAYQFYKNNGIDVQVEVGSFKFSYGDGRNNAALTFDLKYKYTPCLDVETNTKSGAENDTNSFRIVDIRAEQVLNLFSAIDLKTKSTGKSIQNIQDVSANISIEFINNYSSDNDLHKSAKAAILNSLSGAAGDYFEKANNIFARSFAADSDDYFMRASEVVDSKGRLVRYDVRGYGASNYGNYNLVKVTYSASGYNKDFYVIFRILPAYTIMFGKNEISVPSDPKDENNFGQTPSNERNSVEYFATDLKAEGDPSILLTENEISIKHALNPVDNKANAFTYKIEYNKNVNNEIYNDKTNVTNKLKRVGGGKENWNVNTSLTGEGDFKWDDKSTYLKRTGDIKFGIEETVFGIKKFMLEAIDVYGFTFMYFFHVSSPKNINTVETSISLTEGESFDIGATATYIDLVVNEKDVSFNTPSVRKVDSTTENKVINIDGLQDDIIVFNGVQNEMFGFDATRKIYKLKGDYSWTNGLELDPKYLGNSLYSDIKVSSIELKKEINGKEENVVTLSKTKNLLIDSGTLLPDTTVSGTSSNKFTMPEINDNKYWDGKNEFEATMYIKLTYGSPQSAEAGQTSGESSTNSNNQETYTVSLKVIVRRGTRIIPSTDDYVRDGHTFNLLGQSNNPGQFGINETSEKEIKSIINDTLEVTLPANGNIEFTLTLKRGNEEPISKTITLNSMTNAPKTHYVMISKELGVDIENGDKVSIKEVSTSFDTYSKEYPTYNSGVKFGYRDLETGNWLDQVDEAWTVKAVDSTFDIKVEETAEDGTKTETTVESTPQDQINIVSIVNLENTDNINVKKSYIVNVGAKTQTTEENGKANSVQPIRVEREYHVTWNYSSSVWPSGDIAVEYSSVDTAGSYIANWGKIVGELQLFYKTKLKGEIIEQEASGFDNWANAGFYVEVTLNDNGSGGSGAASFENSNGQLKTKAAFNLNDYITLNLYRKVSGSDDYEKGEYFAQIVFRLKAPSSTKTQ